MASSYKYKDLINTGSLPMRLLRLYPDLRESTLIGQIVQRKDEQRYEALSYCWGSKTASDDSSYISIREDDGYSRLVITPNLAAALRTLRSEREVRPLWIDAVCINQEDDVEKSEQVPLISRIYRKAERVCIWLGEASAEDEIVKKHILRIIELEGFEALIDPHYTTQWAALASLMKREWFSRRWVVQEIAYARKAQVYWGRQEIDWKDLADAVALFGSKADKIGELFRQDRTFRNRGDYLGDVEAHGATRLVSTIDKVFRKADNGQRIETLLSLEALISNLSAFNASRPHDIVYAVLSLAKDARSSAVKPTDTFPQPSDQNLSAPLSVEPHSVNSWRPPLSPRRHSNATGTANMVNGVYTSIISNLPQVDATEPTSLVNLSTNAALFEASPDEIDSAISIIEEDSFWFGDVHDALSRVKTHLKNAGNDFKYKDMIDKVRQEAPDMSEIGKSFWDEESLRWSQEGNKGMHALAWKLLRYERALKQTVFVQLQKRKHIKTFHVDYQKRFYEVCRDFLDFTIRSSKSLDMLCRPWAPDNDELPDVDREETGLPSWICPLSQSPFQPRPDGNFGRVHADLLVGMPDATGGTYTASSATVPAHWFFGGKRKRNLFVTGSWIDEIRECETEAVEGNIPNSWLRLAGWTDTKKDDPPESFWRTIVADRNERGQNPPSYYQRACKYAFSQRTSRGSLNTDRLINNNISQVTTEYLKRVQAIVWMRKLIRTVHGDSDPDPLPSPADFMNAESPAKKARISENGRLGLAPATAQKGDKICLLRGCSVPVVLRDVVDESASDRDEETQKRLGDMQSKGFGTRWSIVTCKLIGECYIHGIMDGEAFQTRLQGQLLDCIFELQ